MNNPQCLDTRKIFALHKISNQTTGDYAPRTRADFGESINGFAGMDR